MSNKKVVLISQRPRDEEHNIVDYLERPYVRYFKSFGVTLIPVPNIPGKVVDYFELPTYGVILSGGNDSKERDETETKLIEIAIEKYLPVLGICKGAQFINLFFGGKVVDVEGHVAQRHTVEIVDKQLTGFLGKKKFKVNSFHNRGITRDTLSPKLKVFAVSSDGIVEGLFHPNKPIAGILWHPEREGLEDEANKKIITAFLERMLLWR